jgi:hypothetical protein
MNDIHKIAIYTVYLEEGIAPIERIRDNVNKQLSSMSPDEARKMKRKFRKLWRKCYKKDLKCRSNESYKDILAYRWGVQGEPLNKRVFMHRKNAVHSKLRAEKIQPFINLLRNSVNRHEPSVKSP